MIKRLILVAIVFFITSSNYFMAIKAVKSESEYKIIARKMFLESALPIALGAAIFA